MATFTSPKNVEEKRKIISDIEKEVEEADNVFDDIVQFISPEEPEFIFQIAVLCICIVIGVGGAISRIVGFR